MDEGVKLTVSFPGIYRDSLVQFMQVPRFTEHSGEFTMCCDRGTAVKESPRVPLPCNLNST